MRLKSIIILAGTGVFIAVIRGLQCRHRRELIVEVIGQEQGRIHSSAPHS